MIFGKVEYTDMGFSLGQLFLHPKEVPNFNTSRMFHNLSLVRRLVVRVVVTV